MVLVRIVMQTKWGKASEVAQAMAEGADKMRDVIGSGRVRVLTDLSGPFHTVVEEIEVESIGEWEAARVKIFSHPEFQKSQESIEGMIESGSMEFYAIEYSS